MIGARLPRWLVVLVAVFLIVGLMLGFVPGARV
jgi:hypothetical protein